VAVLKVALPLRFLDLGQFVSMEDAVIAVADTGAAVPEVALPLGLPYLSKFIGCQKAIVATAKTLNALIKVSS
jgi:hypothetical protein